MTQQSGVLFGDYIEGMLIAEKREVAATELVGSRTGQCSCMYYRIDTDSSSSEEDSDNDRALGPISRGAG